MHEGQRKFAQDNKDYKEFIDHCKELAERQKSRSKYGVEFIPQMMEGFERYIEDCQRRNKPLTISGFVLSCDMSSEAFNRMGNGDYDHRIEEYKLLNNLPPDCEEHNGIPLIYFSEIIRRCRLMVQRQLEENLYTNRGNPAGSIFSLKCNFKWVEDQAPQTLNQTLVIADAEQAKKALDMLK